ncbi:MAG: P1 family peptidase [Acidimicrobiales bacterium]|nr:P1 family peptidase [Acidimicrobiales bacterium]
MLTDVKGIRVGHWTDAKAQTGCTAVILPKGNVASGEVRGGAPGTREFDLLAPGRLVESVDVVMLSGGSAFGLATCDGAMQWCEDHKRGYKTGPGGLVPIVVGAIIFDLAVGSRTVRPDAVAGYSACDVAKRGRLETGRVGAGTGATIGKIGGPGAVRPGGLGTATERDDELVVSALIVANAAGHLRDGSGAPTAWAGRLAPLENTTIGVIATNATLDKSGCHLVAQSGHHGVARAFDPSHTRFDGDALVSVATGEVEADLERVRFLAAHAVEQAIRNACA